MSVTLFVSTHMWVVALLATAEERAWRSTLRNRWLSFPGRGALCGPMRAQTCRGELGMASIGRVGYVTVTPHKGVRRGSWMLTSSYGEW